MIRPRAKWFGVILALVLLTPVVSTAERPRKGCDDRDRDSAACRQVPEGGSAATYLLGAGILCLGGMLVRSRASKPRLT